MHTQLHPSDSLPLPKRKGVRALLNLLKFWNVLIFIVEWIPSSLSQRGSIASKIPRLHSVPLGMTPLLRSGYVKQTSHPERLRLIGEPKDLVRFTPEVPSRDSSARLRSVGMTYILHLL